MTPSSTIVLGRIGQPAALSRANGVTKMRTDEKIKLYRDANRAFHALCEVIFPNDERRQEGLPQQLLEACESTVAGLSIHIARLESEIGTDNL